MGHQPFGAAAQKGQSNKEAEKVEWDQCFYFPPENVIGWGIFISIKAYQKKIANTSVLVMRQLGNGL